MSRYIQLLSGRRLSLGEIPAAKPNGNGDGPVHLLWPRKTLFGDRRSIFPKGLAAVDDCRCSVWIALFLIWATRHAHAATSEGEHA